MNFNKIEETIRAKNFTIKYILDRTTKMSPNGFRIALKKKTLKVAHLEKITEAIGLPMKYWWEEEDNLLKFSGDNLDNKILKDEIEKLKKKIILQETTIENLNTHINDLKERLGFRKASG